MSDYQCSLKFHLIKLETRLLDISIESWIKRVRHRLSSRASKQSKADIHQARKHINLKAFSSTCPLCIIASPHGTKAHPACTSTTSIHHKHFKHDIQLQPAVHPPILSNSPLHPSNLRLSSPRKQRLISQRQSRHKPSYFALKLRRLLLLR